MAENKKLWREMQEPHESHDAVNKAASALFDDCGVLREKHHVADLLVVAHVSYLDGEDEVDSFIPVFYGDSMKAEAMAAFVYGHYAGERQRVISEFINAKALKRQKDRP